jgi:hypothetical protein
VLVAALSCRWWPFARPQVPDSLPERLASASGRGPEAVLLVVGAGFLIGSRFVGGDEIAVVCVVTLLALRAIAGVRREARSPRNKSHRDTETQRKKESSK